MSVRYAGQTAALIRSQRLRCTVNNLHDQEGGMDQVKKKRKTEGERNLIIILGVICLREMVVV